MSLEALERDERAREPAGIPAVECEGLTFRFGSHTAVDGVNLEVRAGEVFGLLGPNGAGKTTTIRVLTTLLPAAEGSARIFGIDVARHRMRLAGTYSGGMIRRLELAQALINRPRLLILDEPTIGLDPIARAGVWERLQELRAASGMTILLTTHYLDEADHLCERIALMHRGRLRAVGAPDELKAELGPDATLEDVFRRHTGERLEEGGDIRDVRGARRTARRLA